MLKFFIIFLFLLLAGCGSGGSGHGYSNSVLGFTGLLVPAYFRDEALYDVLEGAPSSSSFYVIVNPDNGPGVEPDPFFSDLISGLRRSGKSPVGYIHTSWGGRKISEIESEIDKWLEFYPEISGFFFDEVSVNPDKLSYYKEIYRYVKSKGNYFVVLNPGTLPEKDFFTVSDAVVIFESDYSNLKKLLPSPDRSKSACIVTGVPEELWEQVLSSLRDKCSLVYVTSNRGSNPYSSLPEYFIDEVKAVLGSGGEGGIRTRGTGFKPVHPLSRRAPSASSATSPGEVVSPGGFEPPTYGLKVRCSTS